MWRRSAIIARLAGADSRIEWRIGINRGDVIVEGDDLYGRRGSRHGSSFLLLRREPLHRARLGQGLSRSLDRLRRSSSDWRLADTHTGISARSGVEVAVVEGNIRFHLTTGPKSKAYLRRVANERETSVK
jgi:hypothetical protein